MWSESASLPRRRTPARRCRTAASVRCARCAARQECRRRRRRCRHSVRHRSRCRYASRSAGGADRRPARCPRTVPSASSLTVKPGFAHPRRDQIGGAAMFRRQKQPHQPRRLGRDRAERVDHGFGARAEIGNVDRIGIAPSFQRRDPRADLVALGVGHAGLIAERHRLVDHGLGQDQRRISRK